MDWNSQLGDLECRLACVLHVESKDNVDQIKHCTVMEAGETWQASLHCCILVLKYSMGLEGYAKEGIKVSKWS